MVSIYINVYILSVAVRSLRLVIGLHEKDCHTFCKQLFKTLENYLILLTDYFCGWINWSDFRRTVYITL